MLLYVFLSLYSVIKVRIQTILNRIGYRIEFTADKLLTTREIMKGFHQKRTEKKATRTSYHGEEKCNQQTNVTLVSLRELDERKDERNTLTVAIA